MDSDKIAKKIIAIFDIASMDRAKIDRIVRWTKNLASVPVMAKIIYFCERMLGEDDEYF